MKVKFSRKAVKYLKKLDIGHSKRINSKIRELIDNPVPSHAKTITGYKELIYRIRVGDYRVLYEIDNKEQIIGIIKVDKRGRVY